MGDGKHAVGDELGAVPYYQRAIELDPNFAMAYARLGAVYNNMGQTQLSEANRQKAFELRDRASEREKLYIMSHYYADSGQLDKGMTALELYRQTYPRDMTPHNNLAAIYNQFGQFDNALVGARKSVDLDPDSVTGYENLAQAYAGLGRVDEARATLNHALERKLSHSVVYIMMAQLDWADGKDAELEKDLQIAAARPDGEVASLKMRSSVAASRGQVRLSRDYARKASDALDRLHLTGRVDFLAEMAAYEALVGNRNDAIRNADDALRSSRTFNVLWNAALAFAAAHQEQKALSLADEIQRTRPNDTVAQNVAVPMTRALAHLMPSNPAQAAPEKAIDLLNAAAVYMRASTGILYCRGLAYKQAGRYPEAIQDFQKIIDLKSARGPDSMVSIAGLEMGRVYQKQGDAAKARIAYQNFIAAWKDADSDVPLLLQAKAEYAKLQ
jgi:tetratricopeptide (TPR) repeat protein